MAKKELKHIKGPDFTKYFVPIIEILKGNSEALVILLKYGSHH